MLKKVLRYDLKAIYKYWWIGAVACFAFSLLGSVGISFYNSEKELPVAVEIFSVISIVLAILGYVAFIFLAQILVIVRYYKNFYSDEGYLTFTLPVKRIQLLNSKLITGTVTSISTAIFCFISAAVMLVIGFRKDIFTKEAYDYIIESINEFKTLFETTQDIVSFIVFIAEILIMLLFVFIISHLFMYLCICIGAMISKKAKVASAIGVYYGANLIATFILQMFTVFVSSALTSWLWDIPESKTDIVLLLIGLILLLFVALIFVVLYSVHYILLDKKLNLS